MSLSSRQRWLAATPVVLLLGALEDWFGKTDSGDVYGSDAVQYLDIARAFVRHDWHAALNPLWSQGYPALLALMHVFFPLTPWGDWLTTRLANLIVFLCCWIAFGFLLAEIGKVRALTTPVWFGSVAVFLTAQLSIDQASRVGPDQFVAALFFLACALLLRGRRRPGYGLGALLGLTLGVGFLVKAAFLVLGCAMVAVAALTRERRRALLPAAGVFGLIVLSYGAALSHAVGHATLGEAGRLNYAWHVDRLDKWVHWEGGTEPADRAWPRPAIARFAHWQAEPPDFGRPMHPSVELGSNPTVLVFHAPVEATYVPYYDPAWFYAGYHPVFRWRYQLIALVKNSGDLLHVLLTLPLTYALLLLLAFSRRAPPAAGLWPVVTCALIGVALYLPVHLEGRYLSAFLAALAVSGLVCFEPRRASTRGALPVLFTLLSATAFVHQQGPVYDRILHHWSPRDNPEWRTADAVLAGGPPRGSQIGMISWTPNLHADWAYMAGLQITSEIAAGSDEAAFWALSAQGQAEVLDRFQRSGAVAVLTQDPPRNQNSSWQQLANAPIWIHRF